MKRRREPFHNTGTQTPSIPGAGLNQVAHLELLGGIGFPGADPRRRAAGWGMPGWRAPPPSLAVPSVLVPEESNLLINPEHSGFAGAALVAERPFSFDPRLVT